VQGRRPVFPLPRRDPPADRPSSGPLQIRSRMPTSICIEHWTLSKEDLGAILPLDGHWSTRGDASWRRALLASGPSVSLRIGDAPMAEQRTATCPECSRTISPDDTVVFGLGRLSHLDCGRPRVLSAEERALLFVHCRDHQVGACVTCSASFGLRDLASDLVSGHTHLCPRCRRDLTASIRAHLYGCTILPAEVRQRAFAARAAAQRLVKRSREPGDTADVLTREAEAALASLREAMRQSLPRNP